MSGATVSARQFARRLDVGAGVIATVLASWTAVVAGGGSGRPGPIVLLLVGLAVAVVAGRTLARWPGLVPKAVAGSIGSTMALTYPALLSAGGAPTGYANANAALAAVGAVAAVASLRHAPARLERRAWALSAAALVLASVLTRSTAGVLVLLAAGALWLLTARAGWSALAPAGGAIAVSIALAATMALATDDSLPLASTDAVRVDLWSAAVDLAAEHPVRGLGAGAFEERNPVTTDADLRWVHQEYLELAVELGGVGLLLTCSLGLVVLARLAIAGAEGTPAAIAVTVVAAHATVDHVWHAPVVLLLTAFLVGDATGADRSGRSVTTDRGMTRGGRVERPVACHAAES